MDVILRRQDDAFCDPLALHQHSLLGTPGLVQAIRAGNVAVVNALGSGWLESPALLPFLPALCRHLLQEDLALPSLPTWWCGEAAAWQAVRGQAVPVAVEQGHAGGRQCARLQENQVHQLRLREVRRERRTETADFEVGEGSQRAAALTPSFTIRGLAR